MFQSRVHKDYIRDIYNDALKFHLNTHKDAIERVIDFLLQDRTTKFKEDARKLNNAELNLFFDNPRWKHAYYQTKAQAYKAYAHLSIDELAERFGSSYEEIMRKRGEE